MFIRSSDYRFLFERRGDLALLAFDSRDKRLEMNKPLETMPNLFGSLENARKPIRSPLPMQYLGSKLRISSWILQNIENDFPRNRHLVDLFAGTGAISLEAARRGFYVSANDIQPYASSVLRSLLVDSRKNLHNVIDVLESMSDRSFLLSSGRKEFSSLLEQEESLFRRSGEGGFSWKDYADFVELSELVNSDDDISQLKKRNEWNLFSSMYSNTYFGVRQCIELDAIRQMAENLDSQERNHLIAATISAMTFLVSSTTHLAQFLKVNSESTCHSLIAKRSRSFFPEVINRLHALMQDNSNLRDHTVKNLDFRRALSEIDFSTPTIIYADPPYFKEHYSRYYHMLDTFFLYDYPELTYNTRIEGTTQGRYRRDRIVSDFGRKGKVVSAFTDLAKGASIKGSHIAVSYASSSLVDKEEIVGILEGSGFSVIVHKKDLRHSGQGQARHKDIVEFLFMGRNLKEA